MKIRKATHEELDLVMSVIEDGRAKLAELGIDQWQGANPSRETIAADIEAGRSYVVEDGGRILATAMLCDTGEPDYDAIYDGSWIAESNSGNATYLVIHRIATSADSTRTGAAKFLFKEAERIAAKKGLKSIRIDTHAGNIRMRSLLKKLGYTECGTILLDPSMNEPTRERTAYEKIV